MLTMHRLVVLRLWLRPLGHYHHCNIFKHDWALSALPDRYIQLLLVSP